MITSIFRRGPVHRSDDEYISFREVRNTFGFRTIKIGRWVSKQEQEQAAVHFYDALADLKTILGVPNEVISLRNTLALPSMTSARSMERLSSNIYKIVCISRKPKLC